MTRNKDRVWRKARGRAALDRSLALLACAGLTLGAVPVAGAATLHVPGFVEVNRLPLPQGVPHPLGDVMFSEDGATLFLIGRSERSDSGVWMAPVLRAADGTVTGFGPASLVFSHPFIDTSLELVLETLLFRYNPANYYADLGQRLEDGTIATSPIDGPYYGGFALIPPPLPNAGGLLSGNWPAGDINIHSVTINEDGSLTTVPSGFYANAEPGATGDMQFVLAGAFRNDLMFTNWSERSVSIIDIDPGTGAPVGVAVTPGITLFLSDLEAGPWGLEFDPVTGNLLVSLWANVSSVGMVQISGFPPYSRRRPSSR